METIIDVNAFETAIGRASEAASQATFFTQASRRAGMMPSSSVPGLGELGRGHVDVLNGSVGSSLVVMEQYAQQLSWMHDNLKAMKGAFVLQDMTLSSALDVAGLGGSDMAAGVAQFPARPAADFQDFPFPTPSAGGHSLQSLSLAFATTNTGAYTAMADRWREMARRAETLGADISTMVGDIVAHNKGEPIDKAQAVITELAEAARAFSANASTMAASVETLVSIHSQGQSMVDSALNELDAIEDPDERRRAHADLLDSFLTSFDQMLTEGIPPINNLMQLPAAAGQATTIALGASAPTTTPLNQRTTPTIAGTAAGAGAGVSGASAPTSAQFGAVSNNLDQLKGIGTQTASHGASTLTPGSVTGPSAPHLSGGGAASGGFGGAVVGGGVRAPRPVLPGAFDPQAGRRQGLGGVSTTTGMGAGAAGTAGTGASTSTGAGSGAGGLVRGSALGAGGVVPGGVGAAGGPGARTGSGGALGRGGGAGAVSGVGTGRLGTGTGAGGVGVGVGVGARGGVSGGGLPGGLVRKSWGEGSVPRTPAGGSGAGAGGAAGAGAGAGGRGPMMGGVPMGAGAGRGGQSSRSGHRGKSLNDIEREDNMRALLGPPITWVPTVIRVNPGPQES